MQKNETAVAARLSAPATVGARLIEVDTPALLVDLDAFEFNLTQVHKRILDAGLQVRAHAKAHKSPALALRQIAAGANGICCQKVSEAEIFVDSGVSDVLITNQLVGMRKVERVAQLAKRARIGLCVDHPLHVQQIGEAAAKFDATVEILIELDIGHGRCGVEDAQQALQLAHDIARHAPHLKFAGIHAFRGSAQHMREPQARRDAVAQAVAKIRGVVQLLQQNGYACATITGGGTGTYAYEADSHLYTEVQPGSYVLMDTDYAANQPDATLAELRQVLFGWCSVISVHAKHAVLDGGLKAFAVDQGLPRILSEGWSVKALYDEHTVIVPAQHALPLQVGDKVMLVPSHCDPTVNLHDWLVAYRGDTVQELWPVLARGALF